MTQGGTQGVSGPLVEALLDNTKRVFQISIVTTVALYAYLLYGLLTGALVNVPHMSHADQARILDNISRLSLGLDVSLAALIVSAVVLYFNEAALGYIFLGLSLVFAYGLRLAIDYFFESNAARYTSGLASQMTLHEIWKSGIFFGIAGVLLVLRHLVDMMRAGRYSDDLTFVAYGKEAVRETVPKSVIPVLSKCWQMPFCRAGMRNVCAVYHAKTKCWKQRVGCMCEENLLRMVNAPEERAKALATPSGAGGFVPIGDLISQSAAVAADREKVPTRVGPNGVRLPFNPHLSGAQLAERCRNCVIYNEHQRYKYQLLAPLVTLLVPVLVYFEFDNLRVWLGGALSVIDGLVARLSLSASPGTGPSMLTRDVTSSVSVEFLIIGCLTLMAMTWALRVLEYCVYKLKI